MSEQARYAVYFSPPPGSVWGEAGARWLGRSYFNTVEARATGGPALPQGWNEAAFAAITRAPRRYGWHATLKAPFRLAAGHSEAELLAAVQALAVQIPRFKLPTLAVQRMGHFLAVVPQQPCAELQALAQRCVVELHDFAALPDEADIASRIAQGRLDDEQQALLRRWGYPHVMHRFRFHMTLTGDLSGMSAAQQAALQAHAHAQFGALPQPLPIDALSLLRESRKGSDFRLVAQAPLR
jgi:2'-5' RNA ligase